MSKKLSLEAKEKIEFILWNLQNPSPVFSSYSKATKARCKRDAFNAIKRIKTEEAKK